ncbi:MAG: LamG-like jellyroll fold domain-containing protein, partial [Victivallales bacterium]
MIIQKTFFNLRVKLSKNQAAACLIIAVASFFMSLSAIGLPVPVPVLTYGFDDKQTQEELSKTATSMFGLTETVDGVIGKALRCNGNNEKGRGEIIIECNNRISLSEGSISFWVKPELDFDSMDGGWGYTFVDSDARNNDRSVVGLSIGFNPQGGFFYAGFSNSGQFPAKVFGWDGRFNRHSWNHICMTWKSGGQIKLYLNASMEGKYCSAPYKGSKDAAKGKMYLGPGIGISEGLAFDEFKLFRNELSSGEVADLYKAIGKFQIDWESAVKRKVVDQGAKIKVNVISDIPVPVIAEIVDNEGKAIWTAKTKLEKGKNEVGFDFTSIIPSECGRYYAKILIDDANSSYSQAFSLVLAANRSSASDDFQGKRKLLFEADCSKDISSSGKFYENVPSVVKTTPMGVYRETSGFFSYRFDIGNPFRPHVMIVEYPDNALRAMAFDINDGAIRSPQGGGVVTGFPGRNTNRMLNHELVFWPYSKNCAVTIYNWNQNGNAAIASLKIYEVIDGLEPLKIFEPDGEKGRELGTQVEDASATTFWGGYDEGLGRWNTTLDHMIDFMKHTGQNSYEYPIMWYGGSLFRSPYNDSFGPNTQVRSGHPDGTFPLILKKFEKAGIKFYPELYFRNMCSLAFPSGLNRKTLSDNTGEKTFFSEEEYKYYFPEVKAADKDMLQVNLNGKTRLFWLGQCVEDGPELGPMYNPLHPTVQKALFSLVDDFMSSAGNSKAFGGFKIDLNSWGCTPSDESLNFERLYTDYSDFTISLFEKETGLKIPGELTDSKRYKKRYLFLTSPDMKDKWVSWRCAKIHALFMEIGKKVWSVAPEAELVISLSCGKEIGPRDLDYPINFYDASRECGIDPSLFTDPRVVIEVYDPIASNDNAWVYRGFDIRRFLSNNNPSVDDKFTASGRSAFVQWLCYWEIFEPVYKALWPEVKPNAAPVRQITPSGEAFLKIWAEKLALSDFKKMYMGGMGCSPFLGHKKEFGDFAKAFRYLPNQNFLGIPNENGCVAARYYKGKNKTYCYFVNREPYEIEIEAQFEGAKEAFCPVSGKLLSVDAGRLLFKIPAYGLRSFGYDKNGSCKSFAVFVPAEEIAALAS